MGEWLFRLGWPTEFWRCQITKCFRWTPWRRCIDWSKPGQDIYNLIRGGDPQPGTNSTLNGQKVCFYDASFAAGEPTQAPGSVVATGERLEIAVDGGVLSIGRLRGADGKQSAADFVAATGISKGSQFGS